MEIKANKRGFRGKFRAPLDNFVTKTTEVKAVSVTTKCGRQRSFTIAVMSGDEKGSIGFGKSKAKSLANASRSAIIKSKKKMKLYNLEKTADGYSLTHTVKKKFCGVNLTMSPRRSGGLKAHSVIVKILKCMGVKHAVCKIHGNATAIQNIVKATIGCLDQQETLEAYAKRLNISPQKVKNRIYSNLWRKK